MSEAIRVAKGVAGRSLMLIPRVPSTFFPSLIMPIFLLISFSGQFDGLSNIPGFPTDNILNWFLPMTMIQGSAFAGVTTGMGVARDLENGFFDRFLLAPVSRVSLLGGPLAAGVARAFIPITLLMVVAIVSAAEFQGGVVGALTTVIACLGIALAAGAWALGLALRFKTMQVVPLMQIGIFLTVFLSTAQMPLPLIEGWTHGIARFNPMTNVLALAREGFLGDVTWEATWPGFVALAGMNIVLVLFAYRGLRKATP